ncbi:AAA family ATPase [Aeromonas veronii]|uniref:AAA family ATPase n=1 Tax=Aeromonas veronii TaxID=654 RepID=UPI001F189478|nr:AAA family ATPase [Aeromonas veronii]MCF5860163.1 AAA family ATPase [Aeromonas veronii]
MSNFTFLEKIQPALAQLGCSAELYCHNDRQAALVKLRCFVEIIVGDIYSSLALTPPERDDLYNRLRDDEFKNVVGDRSILTKLDTIRFNGNKAAHSASGTVDISIDETFWLIKEAFLIARWYAQTILNETIFPPEFVNPVQPVDITASLQAELLLQQQELATRESELKAKLAANQETFEQKTTVLLAELSAKNDALSNVNKEQALLQITLEQKQKDLMASQQAVSNYQLREEFKQASMSSASSFDLDMELTRRNIDIFDCFEDVTLTSSQRKVVNQVNDFLKDPNQNVFLLNGYAGTGKTFITKGITQYLDKIGREFKIMAPTGKAAKVISDKTMQAACTIHRAIYNYENVKEFKVDGIDGSETYRCYAELKVNVDTAEAVYIIDEASMVSDKYSDGEFFQFGSGYLLRDLLKFINFDHNDHNKKIIFIGDNAQLPPVGMNTSPALDAFYLNKNYQLKVVSGCLTEVVRQRANSGVLVNAAMLRDGLEQKVFNKLQFVVNNEDVCQLYPDNLLNAFLETCDGKIGKTGESVIIASSNRQVGEYNRLIREQFFNGQKEMARGDKVISVANHYRPDATITNGEFGMIKEVISPHPELVSVIISVKGDTGQMVKRKVDLSFRDVILGFRNDFGEPFYFEAKVIENLLYNDEPALSSDEHKAIYVHFLNRNPELKRKGNEQKRRVALLQDPYFNAFKIKFGYAITGHKAQGSEWKNVFLQCQTHYKKLTKEYFRWLYTAITRASETLYVMDPPNISLWPGEPRVKPDATPELPPEKPTNDNKDIVQRPVGPEPVDTFIFRSDKPQLQRLYQCVKAGVDGTGISIVDVLHYDHQERYIFKRGNEQASISFIYKGSWKISHVNSLGQGGFDTELMTLLAPLEGTLLDLPEPKSDGGITFSHPCLKELYEYISSQLIEEDVAVTKIKSREFCERYYFQRKNELAVIDIFYNDSYQFKKTVKMSQLSNSTRLMDEVIDKIGAIA